MDASEQKCLLCGIDVYANIRQSFGMSAPDQCSFMFYSIFYYDNPHEKSCKASIAFFWLPPLKNLCDTWE